MNRSFALCAPHSNRAHAPSHRGKAPIQTLPIELKRLIIDYVHTADLPHLVEAVPSMMVDAPRWSSHRGQVVDHYPTGFLSGDPAQAWCLGEQLHRAQKNLWRGHIFAREAGNDNEMVAGATSGDVMFHFFDGYAELTAISLRRWPVLYMDGCCPSTDRETGETLFEPQAWALAESPSGRWLASVSNLQPSRMLASRSSRTRAVESLPANKTIVGLPQVLASLPEEGSAGPKTKQNATMLRLLDLACYPPSSVELCSGSYTQGSDLLFCMSSTHLLLVHRQPHLIRAYGRLSLLRLPSPSAAGAWCLLPLGFRGEADVTPLLLPTFGKTVPWIFSSAHDSCAAILLEPSGSHCQALRLPLKAPAQQADAVVSVDRRHLLIRIDAHLFLLERSRDGLVIQMDWTHTEAQQAFLCGVSFRFFPQRLAYALRQIPRVTNDWYQIDCTKKEKQPQSILASVRPIRSWSWCGSPSTICDIIGRLELPVGAIFLAPRDNRFVLKALLPREGGWTSCPLGDELFDDLGDGITVDMDRAGRLLACSSESQAPVVISLPRDGRPASSRLFEPLSPAAVRQVFFSKLADVVLATLKPVTLVTTVTDPNHLNFVGTRPNPLRGSYGYNEDDSDDESSADASMEENGAPPPFDRYGYGLHAWRTDEQAFGKALWLRGINEGNQPVQSTKDGTALCLLDMFTQEIIDFVG